MLKAAPVVAVFYTYDAKLSFSRADIQCVVTEVYELNKADLSWKVQDEHLGPWVTIMTNRVCNILHDTKDAMGSQRKWLQKLQLASSPPAPAGAPAATPAPVAPPPQYAYDWNPELKKAFRVATRFLKLPEAGQRKHRQYCARIQINVEYPGGHPN